MLGFSDYLPEYIESQIWLYHLKGIFYPIARSKTLDSANLALGFGAQIKLIKKSYHKSRADPEAKTAKRRILQRAKSKRWSDPGASCPISGQPRSDQKQLPIPKPFSLGRPRPKAAPHFRESYRLGRPEPKAAHYFPRAVPPRSAKTKSSSSFRRVIPARNLKTVSHFPKNAASSPEPQEQKGGPTKPFQNIWKYTIHRVE